MIDPPVIADSPTQRAAVIRLVIPREKIQEVMGPAIGEIYAAIGSQNVAPAGPLFSHHFCVDAETFDFEVGVPVSVPFTPSGRVYEGELPAARVVRTIYHGPYEGLGEAWGEFEAWIGANGYETARNLWERYLLGPEATSDSAQWLTELNHPLR